ncbi:MAG: hypothetical protein ACOZE5_00320 [Verrucomicrobiota bacterium]
MKLRLLVLCLLSSVFCLPTFAQTQDESTRLMQEYMARRAEWVELRRAALDKVKAAKDDKERKQHRDKLAEDEKPVLARMAEAARAYQAVEKAKRDQLAEGKPRG